MIVRTGKISSISGALAPANTNPFSTSPATEVSSESYVQKRYEQFFKQSWHLSIFNLFSPLIKSVK